MHRTDVEPGFFDSLVTGSAGLRQIGGVDGRSRIARTQNRVHAETRRAVRGRHFAFFQSQSVIAVGVGRQAIGGQIVAQGQARIAVATSAGLGRDVLGIQGRARTLRVDDLVLAVTVDAHGSIPHAVFHGLPVNAFVELAGDFLVALGAGPWHVPVIDPRAPVGRGIDVMTAVATGAGSRFLAHGYGARVHALLVGVDGMRYRNFVAREESRIAVTLGACVGNVPGGDG